MLGMLTGALSLTVAGLAVDTANALSAAVLGEKLGESASAAALSLDPPSRVGRVDS